MLCVAVVAGHRSSLPTHRLTDDVSRENWIKYGNPDGPQAATFGIALPSWVVEKQNSVWVSHHYLSLSDSFPVDAVITDCLCCRSWGSTFSSLSSSSPSSW